MAEITTIPLSEIDPESTVNVRINAVEQNVEKVKRSIETHGYWSDQPITLRPHPDEDSPYSYEYVAGQCRFKASSELGLEEIPAVVVDLDDDEALRRSWTENAARGDLTTKDKAHWVERKFNDFWKGSSLGRREAYQKTAEWLGYKSVDAVIKLHPLSYLPEEVINLIEQNQLAEEDGRAVANSVSYSSDNADELMLERAKWLASKERPERVTARKVISGQFDSSIDELQEKVDEEMEKQNRVLNDVELAKEDYERLMEWGKERGLNDIGAIVSNLIATTVRGGKR